MKTFTIPRSNGSIRAKLFIFLFLMLLSFPAALSAQCEADAGGFSTQEICMLASGATLKATPAGDAVVPDGFETLYVLTTGSNLVIQQVAQEPSFTVDAPLTGLYTIHTLVYDAETLDLAQITPGVTTGGDVNTLLIQGGGDICAALDVAGVKFRFGSCDADCLAEAATISTEDATTLCANSLFDVTATGGVGANSAWIITDAENNIQLLPEAPPFDLSELEAGVYRVWHLTYDGDIVNLEIGNNAADLEGCFALSNFIGIELQKPTAATISTDDPTTICADDGVADPINVTVEGGNGTASQWVITDADGNILALPESTPFDLEGAGTGVCQIWYLTYDGELQNAAIDQNVSDLIGCFALSNPIEVTRLTGEDCNRECDATAGKLRTFFQPCVRDGAARLVFGVSEAPVVPEGFEILYVLTAGSDLVIEQVGTERSFTVSEPGRYRVHTLVYDNSLNLEDIVLGETTATELNATLIQGGGNICAALDLTGAFFYIARCPDPCYTVDAGSLKPKSHNCLDFYEYVTIKAESQASPNVPSGFVIKYLLATGNEKIIQKISNNPSFEVADRGIYSIHRFVYDPDAYNIDEIDLGELTIAALFGMQKSEGGDICGDVDVEGAVFDVSYCRSCYAFAGSLWVHQSQLCLRYGSAQLLALHYRTPIVPDGYKVKYLLSKGEDLIIKDINDQPVFEVYYEGDYKIHTLVYNPEKIDLHEILDFGTTTIYDIEGLLYQGGGDYCGSLDVPGAAFHVKDCHSGHLAGESSIYPNPAENLINLTFDDLIEREHISIRVVDLAGKTVYSQQLTGNTQATSVDISDWRAGMYLLEIRYDDELIQQEKIIKSK